jgi:hypothetical protein
MQLKKVLLPFDIGTRPAPPHVTSTTPPVADLSAPQASNRRVMTTTSTTATEELRFEVLAEGKSKI